MGKLIWLIKVHMINKPVSLFIRRLICKCAICAPFFKPIVLVVTSLHLCKLFLLSVLLHFKTIILVSNIFAMLLFNQALEFAPISALIATEAVEQAVLAHAKRVHV